MTKGLKAVLAVLGLGVLCAVNVGLGYGFVALLGEDTGNVVSFIESLLTGGLYGWYAVAWIDPFDLRTGSYR